MSLRYVAIGDSTVEGIHDPGPGGAHVGWADRLAQHLAVAHPDLTYANLAVRGQTAHEVRTTQLDPALNLRPDIAVVVAGVNDVLRPRFHPRALRRDLRAMHAALHEAGARVLTFTMPDMARVAPPAVVLRGRLRALNDITHELGEQFGTTVVDLAAEPVARDPSMWHHDRLHANSEGHRRIAAALAESLGLDAGEWRDLPSLEPGLPRKPRQMLSLIARETVWVTGHVLPRAWRHMRGHEPVKHRVCKRPDLLPLQ